MALKLHRWPPCLLGGGVCCAGSASACVFASYKAVQVQQSGVASINVRSPPGMHPPQCHRHIKPACLGRACGAVLATATAALPHRTAAVWQLHALAAQLPRPDCCGGRLPPTAQLVRSSLPAAGSPACLFSMAPGCRPPAPCRALVMKAAAALNWLSCSRRRRKASCSGGSWSSTLELSTRRVACIRAAPQLKQEGDRPVPVVSHSPAVHPLAVEQQRPPPARV